MSVIKADEISISEYLKRFEQNASQSWTQRLQPVSATKSSWQFNFSAPGFDTLMGAQVWLEAKFKLNCSAVYDDPAAIAKTQAIAKREGYPLTSAMRSCALTLNGQSISYKPNTFIKELSYLNVGESQGKRGKVCEPLECGLSPAYVLANQNVANVQNRPTAYVQSTPLPQGIYGKGEISVTESYARRMKEFDSLPRVQDNLANANRGKLVQFFEPVFMPITNFFGDVAYDSLPSWSPWRGFSQVIPHCNNVSMEFQFSSDRLTSELFEIRSGPVAGFAGGGFHTTLEGKPTLYVRWFKVANSIASIPRVASLQSVYIDRHPLTLPGGTIALAANAVGEAQIPYIKLSSPPTAIIIAIRPDMNHVYNAEESVLFASNDTCGGNQPAIGGAASLAYVRN